MSEILDFKGRKKRLNIAICIPSTDMVHADFAMSLVGLATNSAVKVNIGIINEKGSIIQRSRHTMVETALGSKGLKFDKILFIDTDMTFPAEGLLRLLACNKPVVGCNATTKRPPIQPTCRALDKSFINPDDEGVIEVGYIGTAFLLVDLCVFKAIGKPYFRVDYDAKKDIFNGEDYNFCDDARSQGFKVYCDNDLSNEIGHIGLSNYKL